MTNRASILAAIDAERTRQELLHSSGVLSWVASAPECPELLRLAALVEEMGEIGRAIQDCDNSQLAQELKQVAAVAVAWLESLDLDNPPRSAVQSPASERGI